MQVAVFHPQFDFWFVSGIRFFNFYHFGRQSFGVMQLFKRRAGLNFPAKFESAYFNILILLLMTTFLSGGYLVSPWLLLVPGVLLLGIIKSYLKAGSAAIFPLTYLLLQSISAGFAVYSTALYIFALGMHYVEYQVLMYPRVFSTTLETTGIDRIYSVFRSSKWVFYLVLLMAAAVFSITAQSAGDAAASGTSLSLFDALFVFHFFNESFVWKFSNPYYRKQLQQLYF